jgi:hypothetical protein
MAQSTGVRDLNLARNWIALDEMKRAIDLDIVPRSINLGIEDGALMEALETLSAAIGAHFERWRLVAETRKQ